MGGTRRFFDAVWHSLLAVFALWGRWNSPSCSSSHHMNELHHFYQSAQVIVCTS